MSPQAKQVADCFARRAVNFAFFSGAVLAVVKNSFLYHPLEDSLALTAKHGVRTVFVAAGEASGGLLCPKGSKLCLLFWRRARRARRGEKLFSLPSLEH
ncbi:MAG: hypothetical protein K9J81_00860 [Desulfohalobiaceae bacterium]|nr:hypothetical protein [Desulfohalobiaceae bacterium]